MPLLEKVGKLEVADGLREAATMAPSLVGAGPGSHVLEIQICGDWEPFVSTEHKEPSPEFGLYVHGVLVGEELQLLIVEPLCLLCPVGFTTVWLS